MAREHGQFYVASYDLSSVVADLFDLGVTGITYGKLTNLGGEAYYMDISEMQLTNNEYFDDVGQVRAAIARDYGLNYKVQFYSHQYQQGSI